MDETDAAVTGFGGVAALVNSAHEEFRQGSTASRRGITATKRSKRKGV